MSKWSNFAEEARASSIPRGPQCQVGSFLKDLDPADRTVVALAIQNRSLSVPAIYRAIRKRAGGDAPSQWSLGHHRRGACACGLQR